MKKNSLVKVVIQFFSFLVIGLILVFYFHTLLLEAYSYPEFADKINEAYFVNGLLAIIIFLVLFFLRDKLRDQLGFLFMGGSFLKFAAFFFFFYADYRADTTITKLEFLAFFVPYVYSLLIETLALIKLLNLPKKTE
ncbi:MAG: hypothetical protein HWD85_03880 [Flavobacteriaceae bacterium]|nr:hypothetical protein [Flavobacteriaceae bacterium]